MQQSNLQPFLKTGTTLAVLSTDGKKPEEKERLNKSASCLEILCFRRIKILFGILKGPLASFFDVERNFMAPFYGWGSTASRLEPLRGDSLLFTNMMLAISSQSVGWINIE